MRDRAEGVPGYRFPTAGFRTAVIGGDLDVGRAACVGRSDQQGLVEKTIGADGIGVEIESTCARGLDLYRGKAEVVAAQVDQFCQYPTVS